MSEPARDSRFLLEPMTSAVRDAGALALQSFGRPVRSWYKHGNSPVSDADLAVDTLLHERLSALDPAGARAAGWLSEETEDDSTRLATPDVWIVDPIDGTRAFLAGLPDWTISVALARNGRPILAAVYAPVTNEMFLAAAGHGATRNGHPIAASPGAELGGARVAGPKRYLESLAAVSPQIVAVPKVHSLALRLTRVAEGVLDAAFASNHSHDWDLAAADLLVHEAGGALTTFGGEVLAYNRPEPTHGALIAAGRSRHRRLSELIGDRSIGHR